MSHVDDDLDVQARQDERLLTGRSTDEDPALVDLVAALRASASPDAGPAPRPSQALQAVLRDGLPPVTPLAAERASAPAARLLAMRRRTVRRLLGLGLAAKVLLGAGVAMAAVGGAATLDVVPDAVQRPASAVVSDVLDVLGVDEGGTDVPVPSSSPSPSAVPSVTPEPGASPTAAPTAAPTVAPTASPGRSADAPGHTGETGPATDGGVGASGQETPGEAASSGGVGKAVPAVPAVPATPATGRGATTAPGRADGSAAAPAAPAVPAAPAEPAGRPTSAGRPADG
ncbi:hypothetical protein [Cellulomonas soli]|uniref:Uncharacterized protein n=1 Tax=Cellulomonas soli TaxID=931535 RepID=A0A512PDY6_9CELL|nr:hypothetical protein [Cellulomonas soli]NYI59092.1 hypothetical protein [Cellulomonas soli]GEP69417.1 hypothetical protein CSO01_21320 [Cellulomonas soli]